MTGCHVCAAGVSPADTYCGRCGAALKGARSFASLVPAAAAGSLVALAGLAIGDLLPRPADAPTGFVDAILAIVLGTTVPYFDVGFGFIGGWSAAAALDGRSFKTATLASSFAGILYVGAMAGVVATLMGAAGLDPTRLLLALAAAPVGGLLALLLHERLGSWSKLPAVFRFVPGGRYVRTVVGALVTVALLLFVYGLLIVALIAAVVVLALYVGLRIVGAMLGGSSGGGGRRAAPVSYDGGASAGPAAAEAAGAAAEQKRREREQMLLRASGGRGTSAEVGDFYAGSVDGDGIVKDRDGFMQGVREGKGVIKDRNGDYAGSVDSDGIVTDRDGRMVGSVDADGVMRDRDGNVVGTTKKS